MSKVLIAFFSRRGQNYVSGTIKNIPVGNTEVVRRNNSGNNRRRYVQD